MKTRKSWRDKLRTGQEARMEATPDGTMLIPRPLDVDALIKKVQRGKLVTVTQIRRRLARDHGADYTCPLTTGIFIRIAAEVAEEDLSRGENEVTPYWRVVKPDGSLVEKFPGGAAAQASRLRDEGHLLLAGKGKKPPRVSNFLDHLQEL